jgi:hypothetical protein
LKLISSMMHLRFPLIAKSRCCLDALLIVFSLLSSYQADSYSPLCSIFVLGESGGRYQWCTRRFRLARCRCREHFHLHFFSRNSVVSLVVQRSDNDKQLGFIRCRLGIHLNGFDVLWAVRLCFHYVLCATTSVSDTWSMK